jgi:peptide chain release factor 2
VFESQKEQQQILEGRVRDLQKFLGIPEKQEELQKLLIQSANPEFWNNPEKAQSITQRIHNLKEEIKQWEQIQELKEEIDLYFVFSDEEDNLTLENELQELINKLGLFLDEMEMRKLLNGEDDKKDAILTIHPGAGGTESQDWADMLLRMYLKWCEKHDFLTRIVDYQAGEEAGIKDVTVEVSGLYAYGYLKAEAGIHRLVRISPFDANRRRHTSFASVFIYPVVEDEVQVEINPDDLRIDTFRASGAGGQHVNKTSSAVRITHIPTGIVVQCQNERSQYKNKATALKILRARLYQLQKQKEDERKKQMEKTKKDISWGNQIRSYVFHPYNMVKDHRTKVENGNVQAVMDGELDPFIKAYLLINAS